MTHIYKLQLSLRGYEQTYIIVCQTNNYEQQRTTKSHNKNTSTTRSNHLHFLQILSTNKGHPSHKKRLVNVENLY